MLRTAMKPRFVRLFIVMLVLVAAFCWLGQWQWATAHDSATREVLATSNAQRRVPLDQVLGPGQTFDNSTSLRPISARGRYDAAHTELVAGRVLNGKHGWWVMTPLVVDGSGARLPVVRGFVTSTSGIAAPPSGPVSVEGALAPGESQSQQENLPKGQIGTIDLGLLLNAWGGRVYNAFIFATAQNPPSAQGATHVTPVPPPVMTKTSINMRNAAYAVQWWVFAAFAVFMWVKMVRDEHLIDATIDEKLEHETDDPADEKNRPDASEDPYDHDADRTP